MHKNRTLFEDAIDIPLWLEADRATPYAERVRRDRRSAHGRSESPALELLRQWWDDNGPAEAGPGATFERVRRLIAAAMVCIGTLAGSALAAAVLHYDGTHPVNAVTAFSLLVGLQCVTIVITLVLVLPAIPGLRSTQAMLGQINPATIVAAIFKRVAGARLPQQVQMLLDWHGGRAAASLFSKWQLLKWSQASAVAFNAGAIATAMLLVTFTDLAFGWSTTLNVSAEDMQRWIAMIAAPWSPFLPAAVPSAELIQGSRFFRLEGSAATLGAPEAYTGWWPFLLVATIVYGLLPRLVLLTVTHTRLNAAIRALLLEDARVAALLDRMAAPALSTAATERETPRALRSTGQTSHPRVDGRDAAAIIWSDAIESETAKTRARDVLGFEIAHEPVAAGGGATLAEDMASFDRLCAVRPGIVIVFVRAYEPPLLELTDTLATLRSRLGNATFIVHPVPEPGTELVESDAETWARTINSLGDPRTYVESGT